MKNEYEEDANLGPFRTWRSLYVAVVVYTAGLIGLLAWFSVAFDFSVL